MHVSFAYVGKSKKTKGELNRKFKVNVLALFDGNDYLSAADRSNCAVHLDIGR